MEATKIVAFGITSSDRVEMRVVSLHTFSCYLHVFELLTTLSSFSSQFMLHKITHS